MQSEGGLVWNLLRKVIANGRVSYKIMSAEDQLYA